MRSLVLDVQQRKVAWQSTPPDEAALNDVAFSPDGKTVYAGGTNGWVYGYDVATGKQLSRWMTGSGPKFGHRVYKVDVSPDGTLVAAGTSPDGDVYLFDPATGRQVTVVHTGAGTPTALAFSPDSNSFAMIGAGGNIKGVGIWKIR